MHTILDQTSADRFEGFNAMLMRQGDDDVSKRRWRATTLQTSVQMAVAQSVPALRTLEPIDELWG